MVNSDYILDHYGKCDNKVCECLKPNKQWLGRICSHWKPTGAKSFQELLDNAVKIRDNMSK